MDESYSIRKIGLFCTIGLTAVIIRFIFGLIVTDDIFVMCDIGQGDGMYVRIDNVDIVIDTGKDRRMSQCLGRYMNFYDRSIDMLFITNSDIDHYGGLGSLMTHYKIDTVFVPSVADKDVSYFRVIDKLRKRGSQIQILYAGDSITVGQRSKISIIWPTKKVISYDEKPCSLDGYKYLSDGFVVVCSNINRYSQVFWLDLETKNNRLLSFLFTGDVTGESIDNYLIPNIKTHVSDKRRFVVLKVPHHGSKNGLTRQLIEAIDPNIAFISAGRRNSYGHPHKSIINLLEISSVPYYVTAKQNDIVYRLEDEYVITDNRNLTQ